MENVFKKFETFPFYECVVRFGIRSKYEEGSGSLYACPKKGFSLRRAYGVVFIFIEVVEMRKKLSTAVWRYADCQEINMVRLYLARSVISKSRRALKGLIARAGGGRG